MSDRVSVRYELLGIERVVGAGRLIALANVLIDVAGIELTLQGVRVVRSAAGLSCEAPVFRHPRDGRWLPGVLLPPELRDAIGAEVLAAMGEGKPS